MGSSTPPASALIFCRSSRRSCSLRFTKNNNDNNDDDDDNNAFQLLLPALCLALHTDWQPHYACKDCKRQPSCSLQFALPLHTGGQFPHQARKDCERQSRPRGHCVRELQQHVGGCGIAVVKLQVSSMHAVTKQSFCAKLVRSAA